MIQPLEIGKLLVQKTPVYVIWVIVQLSVQLCPYLILEYKSKDHLFFLVSSPDSFNWLLGGEEALDSLWIITFFVIQFIDIVPFIPNSIFFTFSRLSFKRKII